MNVKNQVANLSHAVMYLDQLGDEEEESIQIWRKTVAYGITALLKHAGEPRRGYFTESVRAILIGHGATASTCHKHERAIGHLVRS